VTTLHERAAHDYLYESMADPRSADLLSLWTRRLRDGEADLADFSVYGQTPERFGRWPMEQLCCAVAMHSYVNAGFYACYPLEIGTDPGPDAERERNAAALATVRRPFRADVDLEQNGAAQDGWLTWTAPIPLVRSTGVALLDPVHGEEPVMAPRLIGPAGAPIEIGYTKPSRTLAHLIEEGAVARWPYGQGHMTLIVNLSHFAIRRYGNGL
jgi:hypothetical protein